MNWFVKICSFCLILLLAVWCLSCTRTEYLEELSSVNSDEEDGDRRRGSRSRRSARTSNKCEDSNRCQAICDQMFDYADEKSDC